MPLIVTRPLPPRANYTEVRELRGIEGRDRCRWFCSQQFPDKEPAAHPFGGSRSTTVVGRGAITLCLAEARTLCTHQGDRAAKGPIE